MINMVWKTGLIAILLVTLLSISGCTTGGESGEGNSILPFIIFLVVIFALMYFIQIRPQRKRQKAHQEMTQELQRGDKVITIGGMYGQVDSISDDSVVIKVESGALIRMARSSIAGRQQKQEASPLQTSRKS